MYSWWRVIPELGLPVKISRGEGGMEEGVGGERERERERESCSYLSYMHAQNLEVISG